TAELILGNLPSLTPAARSAGIGVLLARPEWTRKLIAAMDAGKLQVTDLALDQKQALAEHPDTTIRNRALAVLKRGGALPSPDRQKVIDDYLVSTKEKGDVAAGKVVFKNQCAKCHKHNGEGENIGPDLTGMAVHPKEELLVHILDPSRSVEGNFRLYTVVTTDGRITNGLLASESKTAIELFDAEGKKHDIHSKDVEDVVASSKRLI